MKKKQDMAIHKNIDLAWCLDNFSYFDVSRLRICGTFRGVHYGARNMSCFIKEAALDWTVAHTRATWCERDPKQTFPDMVCREPVCFF